MDTSIAGIWLVSFHARLFSHRSRSVVKSAFPQDTYVGLESQGVVTIRNDSEVPIDFRLGPWGGLGAGDLKVEKWW